MCVCHTQIIGVEPELNNFGMAVFNVGHRKNVFLERAAVTTRLGWSIATHVTGGDWAWSEQPAQGINSTESFRAINVPYLFEKYKWDWVDFMKVRVCVCVCGNRGCLCTAWAAHTPHSHMRLSLHVPLTESPCVALCVCVCVCVCVYTD